MEKGIQLFNRVTVICFGAAWLLGIEHRRKFQIKMWWRIVRNILRYEINQNYLVREERLQIMPTSVMNVVGIFSFSRMKYL